MITHVANKIFFENQSDEDNINKFLLVSEIEEMCAVLQSNPPCPSA